MFSRPKILFLVSLLFVVLLNPKFNPYLLFKFLIFYHSSNYINHGFLTSFGHLKLLIINQKHIAIANSINCYYHPRLTEDLYRSVNCAQLHRHPA